MSGKGLIRTLNRQGTRSNKKPAVAQKNRAPAEDSICERCGSIYARSTWRQGRRISHQAAHAARWTICPACKQVDRGEAYGKIIASGRGVGAQIDAVRRRIENVARRAARTQPERKIVSSEFANNTLEVLTTSQKLAHRITKELCKAFGGKASYEWSDDGTLSTTWRLAAS